MERVSLRAHKVVFAGRPVHIDVDGESLTALEGDTIASALIASGRRVIRYDADGSPHGIFCGMGACFECLVDVDGDPSVRSCITPVRPGMRIRTHWQGTKS